ncbi:uncharacterized protein [Canis lupus baileyi]|uniref:uncharacterized protein isoform X2 n=1 Tax=Canis lupus baileyi TaxID=143281 RepID=UPI003B96B04A
MQNRRVQVRRGLQERRERREGGLLRGSRGVRGGGQPAGSTRSLPCTSEPAGQLATRDLSTCSFDKHVLSLYCVPDFVPGTGITGVSKRVHMFPPLTRVHRMLETGLYLKMQTYHAYSWMSSLLCSELPCSKLILLVTLQCLRHKEAAQLEQTPGAGATQPGPPTQASSLRQRAPSQRGGATLQVLCRHWSSHEGGAACRAAGCCPDPACLPEPRAQIPWPAGSLGGEGAALLEAPHILRPVGLGENEDCSTRPASPFWQSSCRSARWGHPLREAGALLVPSCAWGSTKPDPLRRPDDVLLRPRQQPVSSAPLPLGPGERSLWLPGDWSVPDHGPYWLVLPCRALGWSRPSADLKPCPNPLGGTGTVLSAGCQSHSGLPLRCLLPPLPSASGCPQRPSEGPFNGSPGGGQRLSVCLWLRP